SVNHHKTQPVEQRHTRQDQRIRIRCPPSDGQVCDTEDREVGQPVPDHRPRQLLLLVGLHQDERQRHDESGEREQGEFGAPPLRQLTWRIRCVLSCRTRGSCGLSHQLPPELGAGRQSTPGRCPPSFRPAVVLVGSFGAPGVAPSAASCVSPPCSIPPRPPPCAWSDSSSQISSMLLWRSVLMYSRDSTRPSRLTPLLTAARASC